MDEQLNKIVIAGEQVKQTLESKGWVEYIEPILDKMIRDVVGGKADGRWDNGAVGEKNQSDFDLKQLIAYKTALIEFHSSVYRFIDDMDDAKDQLNKNKEDGKYKSDYESGLE